MFKGRSAYESPEETQSSENAEGTHVHISSEVSNPSLITRPGYAQQYDRRGHPENLPSRRLLRQSRRAQNDVLATVGVCVGVDENGKVIRPQVNQRETDMNDRSKVESVMRENEVGLLLAAADAGLLYIGYFCVRGLRHRLQVSNARSLFWYEC